MSHYIYIYIYIYYIRKNDLTPEPVSPATTVPCSAFKSPLVLLNKDRTISLSSSNLKVNPILSESIALAATHILPNQPTHRIDLKSQDQATKHCRFAISALQYSDVATAIINLEAALKLLRS